MPTSTIPSLRTQIFCPLEAYTEILGSSKLFGKCPLHWDKANCRLKLDLTKGYALYWARLGFCFVTSGLPVIFILVRYPANNYSDVFPKFDDNVPSSVIGMYATLMILVICLGAMYALVILWLKAIATAQEGAFALVQDLAQSKSSIWLDYACNNRRVCQCKLFKVTTI